MKIKTNNFGSERAFARTDAITAVFSLLLIGGVAWAGIYIGGEKRQIWVCESHLKQLGQAFSSYTQEHKGALPVAFYNDGKSSNSWDSVIAVYLEPKLAKQNAPEDMLQLRAKVAPVFKCPSDPGPRGQSLARSYSMPVYDINRAGWPPDRNSLGGLGLYLDVRTLKKARKAFPGATPEEVPTINVSIVQNPADTALLVEHISSGNLLWRPQNATVVSTREQFESSMIAAKDFHGGRMNYLMLDGHVELLWPVQSGGHVASGDQGVWSIRPED